MNKYLRFVFGYLALIPLWTLTTKLMTVASDLVVYLGLTCGVVTGTYAVWLTGKLIGQITADLELRDIVSKL